MPRKKAATIVTLEPNEPKTVQLSLLELIDLIQKEHEKVETAIKSALEHARQTGEYLAQARSLIEFGGWNKWIEENCSFSRATAHRYLQVFHNWESIVSCVRQPQSVAQALRVISGSVDDIAVGDIVRVIADREGTAGKDLVGRTGEVLEFLIPNQPQLKIDGYPHLVSLPMRCLELVKTDHAESLPDELAVSVASEPEPVGSVRRSIKLLAKDERVLVCFETDDSRGDWDKVSPQWAWGMIDEVFDYDPKAKDRSFRIQFPDGTTQNFWGQDITPIEPGDLVSFLNLDKPVKGQIKAWHEGGGKRLTEVIVSLEGAVPQILPVNPLRLRPYDYYSNADLPAASPVATKPPQAPATPPAPEPEPVWPFPYRQAVKLVDCPAGFDYWETLIGVEGLVSRCYQPKGSDKWQVVVSIQGERVPIDLPEECWAELDRAPEPIKIASEAARSEPVKPPLQARQGSDVYLTPEKLWRPALQAFERTEYDLDPACNDASNPNVPALRFFTAHDNGLQQSWSNQMEVSTIDGSKSNRLAQADLVWCNPPFSLMEEFVDKLLEELHEQNIANVIWLAKCDCRPEWYKKLCRNCDLQAQVHGSVNWVGEANGSFFGVTLFYFGDYPELFIKAYEEIATILAPVDSNSKMMRSQLQNCQ